MPKPPHPAGAPRIVFRQLATSRVTTVKCQVDGQQCFTLQQKLGHAGWIAFGAYQGDHLNTQGRAVALDVLKDQIRRFVEDRAPARIP